MYNLINKIVCSEENSMTKIIIGVKGTGKTKILIDMINSALDSSKGSVVCIEKGDNLRLTVSHKCRLINSDEYLVTDAQSLYGFIAGLLASNHDITDMFIDATFRICQRDLEAFDKFIVEADTLVSMNLWGFRPDIFDYIANGFAEFLKENINEPKKEYYLPLVVTELIESGTKKVKVLAAEDKWYGVTYKEDKPGVVAAIEDMIAKGYYN
jgi:hypothetical protein